MCICQENFGTSYNILGYACSGQWVGLDLCCRYTEKAEQQLLKYVSLKSEISIHLWTWKVELPCNHWFIIERYIYMLYLHAQIYSLH